MAVVIWTLQGVTLQWGGSLPVVIGGILTEQPAPVTGWFMINLAEQAVLDFSITVSATTYTWIYRKPRCVPVPISPDPYTFSPPQSFAYLQYHVPDVPNPIPFLFFRTNNAPFEINDVNYNEDYELDLPLGVEISALGEPGQIKLLTSSQVQAATGGLEWCGYSVSISPSLGGTEEFHFPISAGWLNGRLLPTFNV